MVRTAVGYTGGTTAAVDYRNMGDHSEAIRIEFDPRIVSYTQLLEIFWESHDPSYDVYSRQYRSAVFYMNSLQQKEAEASRKSIADSTRSPIFTAIEPAGEFFVAEDYHQKYLLRKASGLLQEFQAAYPEPVAFTESTAAARLNGYLGCNGDAEELQKILDQLGLSPQMQVRLVEHVSSSCEQFAGLTCPAPD